MSWHKGFRTEPPTYRPVAVVDIGSNSVRLVVYDGLRRSPTPVFNEKILCGLGKGVAITGKLADSGIAPARARRGAGEASDIIGIEAAARRAAPGGGKHAFV